MRTIYCFMLGIVFAPSIAFNASAQCPPGPFACVPWGPEPGTPEPVTPSPPSPKPLIPGPPAPGPFPPPKFIKIKPTFINPNKFSGYTARGDGNSVVIKKQKIPNNVLNELVKTKTKLDKNSIYLFKNNEDDYIIFKGGDIK